ncbi:MAG: Rossmann-like and DUF2520 domain-containing protein [Flavobacteriaceae bacterium]
MLKIALIGAGNLGLHLFEAWCESSEVQLTQWLNRSYSKPNCKGVAVIQEPSALACADAYVLALPDREIASVSSQLPTTGMALHTSGSMPLEELKNQGEKGILYPLQSFSKKQSVAFDRIPIFLESQNKTQQTFLEQLAKSLSSNFFWMDSKQRLQLHIAAVFVNNFTNHLYQIGADLCQKNNIPFSVLLPLIQTTAAKMQKLSPKEAQTGPARRKEAAIIEKHLEFLDNPQQKELYQKLTMAIQQQYNDEL